MVNLLGGLLLAGGRPVARDELIDIVWSDALPAHPRAALQTLMSRLRTMLGPGTVQTSAGGYQIMAHDNNLDLLRFARLVEAADMALDQDATEAAVATLDRAIELWNLPLLANVSSEALHRNAVHTLTERYLGTQEKRAELRLRLMQHQALIPELTELASVHPSREILTGHLMLALYRSGRPADAVATYHVLQHKLREELGVDPSDMLQQLHLGILRRDPSLGPPQARRVPHVIRVGTPRSAVPASTESAAGENVSMGSSPAEPACAPDATTVVAVPRQLPRDMGDFVGRQRELAELRQILCPPMGAMSGSRIAVLAGPGGIGKTALAIHAGHQLSTTFDDGQIYVDVQETGAFQPVSQVIIAGILRAFGVAGSAIPDAASGRVSMYRSLAADRRFLLVMDNVHDEAQVRDLLPAGPGCAAIVVGRPRLAGIPGARLIKPGVLDRADAIDLLSQITGPGRLDAEPGALAELITLSGGLPLAVRIIGARLAAKPHWRLAVLAKRLARTRHRLDELAYGDLDVRTTISLSYSGLTDEAKLLLRRLALLDDTDFPLWVSAAMLNASLDDAEELCEQLIDAQLLDASGGSSGQHYQMHDLVRAYARQLAATEDSADLRGNVARLGTRGRPVTTGDSHSWFVRGAVGGVARQCAACP
jgi:DNA-binding SARP family transcriptional activator